MRSGRGDVTEPLQLTIALTEEQRKRALNEGLRIERRIPLWPRTFQVRVAILDLQSGRVGSVIIPIAGLAGR